MSRVRNATRTTAVAAVCAAVAVAAGCGSSGSSSAGSNPAPATTASKGSSLKRTTKPKYGAPSANAPVRSGTIQVAYRNIAIFPGKLRVKVGSTIVWKNYDSVEHNVTTEGPGQKFASKNFGEGGTFSVSGLKPGVIHYLCTIHPASMNGTIEVVK